jgi:hypothetical protein
MNTTATATATSTRGTGHIATIWTRLTRQGGQWLILLIVISVALIISINDNRLIVIISFTATSVI